MLPSPQPRLCVPSTVLLLNPVEVQAEFLAVANRLSAPGHSPHSAYTTLLLHAFQATFGPHCDLPGLHCRLQVCARGPWGLFSITPLPSEQSPTLALSRCCCLPGTPASPNPGQPGPFPSLGRSDELGTSTPRPPKLAVLWPWSGPFSGARVPRRGAPGRRLGSLASCECRWVTRQGGDRWVLSSARPRDLEEWGRRAAVRQQARLPLGFQSKSLAELEDIFTETAEAQELASSIGDAAEARQWLRTKLQAVGEKAGFPGVLGEALGRAGRVFPTAK